MLQKTRGIVLRSVPYGDSSLVTTIFTDAFGVEAYMVKGVRSQRARQGKAAFFQPGMLLDLVIHHQPLKSMQYLSDYQAAYIYTAMQEHVVRNSILLFSVELLLRLLPPGAPLPELLGFSFEYFTALDQAPDWAIANFPLYFAMHTGRICGFDLGGEYTEESPHLNLQEGGFSDKPPAQAPFMTGDDSAALYRISCAPGYATLSGIAMNAETRFRLIEWYIAFLQNHSQHMGAIRSLPVLRTILHY